MSFSTPRWWYVRKGAPLSRFLLLPLAWLWAAVTAWKIGHGRPGDPGVAVICIGNLTMGGAGKTPVVREILLRLTKAKIKAHGLSRGHGGRAIGPLQVDPDNHDAAMVGDEALMLAQDFPFWVSQNRLAGAKAAKAAGADVVVMDDGHQNTSVKKALSIIVVDGETRGLEWPFGDGAVFPVGPMREPFKKGLARADAVVVLLPQGISKMDAELKALFGDKPVLIARIEAPSPPPRGPQLGFAGVGKPWKVERALTEAGCQLVDFAPFPDHDPYDDETLTFLAGRAALFGAGMVTTEKDWVRLPMHWRLRVTPWPVRARFENEAMLDLLLATAVGKAPA
jgi:tetraacyldisaccharide 4'-kinase